MMQAEIKNAQLALTLADSDQENLRDLTAKAAIASERHAQYKAKLEILVAASLGKSLATDELAEQVTRLKSEYDLARTQMFKAIRKIGDVV